ncbi:MAG: hypothetical protein LAT55_10300 [Opitutales bacterium]|nr:hypothetical protein [Opitutales bacterium]
MKKQYNSFPLDRAPLSYRSSRVHQDRRKEARKKACRRFRWPNRVPVCKQLPF